LVDSVPGGAKGSADTRPGPPGSTRTRTAPTTTTTPSPMAPDRPGVVAVRVVRV